ncbi:hypothetical protein FSS13T_20890 [Flavobacterium saliperosum S13]|uniref:DUF4468 domain-containing protein n=2 Tax=Flavobacterium saliperosum TaxID=329186 RepID=A0A1G4VR62_9FLAO|nr:hypothetical protein [Flavobacterium saliperosum]ESU24117.1 hypothetical protein FSS13T_20890 [Flavobacterium saliperosum S13]SCX10641.1 hypothetical protein SAMN02927925_01612 [Flavobacterium saliperosum]
MKNRLFLLLVLIASFASNIHAQDLTSLKTEAQKTYEASANLNFDAIFEHTYPKVFEIVSKEQMKEMFDQMMANDQFTIKLIPVAPNFKFGNIKKIENKLFCVVEHDNAMTMKFNTPMEGAEDLIATFKASMKADEVTYDKASNTFSIKMRSTMIAIADEQTKNKWKFLNNDKSGQLFNMLFNEKIKTELGL